MATTLTLRVRGPKGQFTVDSLSADSAISALVSQVAAKAGLAADSIQLLAGFPPQPLDTDDPSRAVGDVLGRERLLTVREGAKAATQAVAGRGKSPTRRRRAPQTASAPDCGNPQKRQRGVSNAPKSGRTSRKKSLFEGVQGEGDVGALLAASAEGGRGKAHRVLRKANKLAVADAYEEARANRRFRAALAGTFVVSDVDASDAEAAEGGTARIRVQFPRGPRSTEEEVVDAIPREALSAVVAAVRQTMGEGGKENLKPHKLARISPRVFWNVARLFGGDISGGLRALLPDADWSFLASRARRQSAKARANALQQEADERGVPVEQVEAEVLAQEQDPGSEEEEEEDGRTAPTAGAAAAADGGHVLGAGVDAGTAAARGDAADDARRRRAAAAAARVGQQGPPGPPVPGAGQARAQSGEDGVREVVEEVVSGSEECEGGEVDAVLAKALAAGARTVGRLADLGDAPLVASGVGAETAADLVREARGRAIDAIMAGLAGSAAACEALADCAVTTPVDLLARSARSIAVELRIAAGNAGCAWDEDAVGRWQQAAERALRHHPWLEQWVYAADWE